MKPLLSLLFTAFIFLPGCQPKDDQEQKAPPETIILNQTPEVCKTILGEPTQHLQEKEEKASELHYLFQGLQIIVHYFEQKSVNVEFRVHRGDSSQSEKLTEDQLAIIYELVAVQEGSLQGLLSFGQSSAKKFLSSQDNTPYLLAIKDRTQAKVSPLTKEALDSFQQEIGLK